MSSRRSGQSSGSSRFSNALETKLQALKEILPGTRNRPSNEVSASEVVHEACKYLQELQRQSEDLSEQISQKLDTIDSDTPQASATIDSDTPQASATATIDSDTPQASATIDSDTPQASTARSSINPDQS